MKTDQAIKLLIKTAVLRYLAGSPAVSHYPPNMQNFVADRMATESITSRADDYTRRMLFGVANKQMQSGLSAYQVSNNLETMAKKAPGTPVGRAALEVAISLTAPIAAESGSRNPIVNQGVGQFNENAAAARKPAPFDRELRMLSRNEGLTGEKLIHGRIEESLSKQPKKTIQDSFDNLSPKKLLFQPKTEIMSPDTQRIAKKPGVLTNLMNRFAFRKRA